VALNIRDRIDDMKSSLSRLSPREWIALGALGLTLVLGSATVVGYVILSGLEELAERNESMRKAIKDLQLNGSKYVTQRQRLAALEVRMARVPLKLNSFVEKVAKDVGVDISETGQVNPVESDMFVQRGLEVKLRKIGLKDLAQLIKQLESSPHIVQITRLSVSARWGEHKDLDVEMVVSTYEKRKREPDAPGPKERS
jgi:hypothetical protein